eukprot:gene15033-17233_t
MRNTIETRSGDGGEVVGFRDLLTVTLADVVDGTYDLRIPRLVALVTSITPSASGDWVLELQDPTGSITGFISAKHMAVLQDRKLTVGVSNTVLLEQVSIFVSAAPVIKRHLCLHSKGAQFPSSEFYALKDLFIATNGTEWHWRDETYGAIWNFTIGANPCIEYWQGVTCVLSPQDSFYYVSKLNLSQYNLVGQLPSSVEQLTQLTHLNLGGNGLVERIPSEIGNLPNLATVLLNNNQFTGSLPTTFSQLNALRQLMLQFNELNGPVQQAFDSSTQTALNYVSLNNNQFSGTLPES